MTVSLDLLKMPWAIWIFPFYIHFYKVLWFLWFIDIDYIICDIFKFNIDQRNHICPRAMNREILD